MVRIAFLTVFRMVAREMLADGKRREIRFPLYFWQVANRTRFTPKKRGKPPFPASFGILLFFLFEVAADHCGFDPGQNLQVLNGEEQRPAAVAVVEDVSGVQPTKLEGCARAWQEKLLHPSLMARSRHAG